MFYSEMTDGCWELNISRLPETQGEPDIAINPNNPDQIYVLAVPDPKGTELKQMTSTNGGDTWFNADFLGNIYSPDAHADPSVAYDKFGNLFVAYLAPAGTSVELKVSTDHGQTFNRVSSWTPISPGTKLDRPVIAIGPGSSADQGSIWIMCMEYVMGNPSYYRVRAAGSWVTG